MDWLNDPIEPMLAKLVSNIPTGDYVYEIKWDGIRALIILENGQIRIQTRNEKDVTRQFPELQESTIALKAEKGVFDSEIVCLNEDGKPSFENVIRRARTIDETKIKYLQKSFPVKCYIFDALFLNGEALVQLPFTERYVKLKEVIEKNNRYCLNELFDDGEKLYRAIQQHQMEGILAKKKDSPYLIGKRSDYWQKVKVRQKTYCVILGYTRGSGSRQKYFGSLHIAEEQDKKLVYRGKVGTGFSHHLLKKIYSDLAALKEVSKPTYAPIDRETTWVEPELIAEVSYTELTADNVFRAPVFEKYLGSIE